jgi:hypothetical protein
MALWNQASIAGVDVWIWGSSLVEIALIYMEDS